MQDYRKNHEPAVDKLKEPILAEITSALAKQYEFNFTRHDVSSLWFLCKQVVIFFSCKFHSAYPVKNQKLLIFDQLKFSTYIFGSVGFLIWQETSLLDITDQACSLFSPTEVFSWFITLYEDNKCKHFVGVRICSFQKIGDSFNAYLITFHVEITLVCRALTNFLEYSFFS